MTINDIRQKFLDFEKKRKHAIIPSASLIPENDPTTLFTSSGMQPLVPYLMGQQHPSGTRLANSQKCFRAEDIDEVGDNRHTTFFEMLGNWSLGDYFKEEQLRNFFDFLTEEIGLNPHRIYVTCFAGDESAQIPRDTESAQIWQKLFAQKGVNAEIVNVGSEEDGGRDGMRNGRIFYYDASKNWWSRSGTPDKMPAGEIGGPDSEVFYDFGADGEVEHDTVYGEHCHPNCDCGRFMEIGNSVFIQYLKRADGGFDTLKQKNVDFGGGLERIAAASINNADVFRTDTFHTVIDALEKLSGRTYDNEQYQHAFRIIADHLRGAVFMIGDGSIPSNTEQGYFVRRLLRRAVRYMDVLDIAPGVLAQLASPIIAHYQSHYTQLAHQQEMIVDTIAQEEQKFRKTLTRGMREFENLKQKGEISGRDAFVLFSTYGFPVELTQELAQQWGMEVDIKAFDAEMRHHRSLSRKGAEQKFKGGLADSGTVTTQLHTATHLLLAGLRKFLGDDVHQAGSNITAERARFDFTYNQKVPKEILEHVEQYVNDAIKAQVDVTVTQMDKDDAQQQGISGSFWDKYPDKVTIYTIQGADGTVWSQELCGGPHVGNTREIDGIFTIVKEQSSSAGVRRIKAILRKS